MNQEQIIQMALDSGMAPFKHSVTVAHVADLERFYEMSAAAEREACAAVCYRHAAFVVDPIDKERIHQCAAAIRARGQA